MFYMICRFLLIIIQICIFFMKFITNLYDYQGLIFQADYNFLLFY
ncbi:Uncharacterized protein dnl_57290 [Desulfonema limicola]|uniref:Uncharacterized protein n=1 Tax=Desulfonema limicola TaxID=45656 RepID=A0A975BCU7_9BACT|nr:Uncharacterized protein dnl_57290 [Desulfonema limicola]